MKLAKINFFLIYIIISTQVIAQDSIETERIAAFGKLWGSIYYFHPDIPYGKINANSLFLDNINNLITEPSSDNYRKSISNMINDLKDPYTRLISSDFKENIDYPITYPILKIKPDNNFMVFTPNVEFTYKMVSTYYNDFDSYYKLFKENKNIIIDLRKLGNEIKEEDQYYVRKFLYDLFGMFSDKNMFLPGTRTRAHFGYESEWNTTSDFTKGWILENGQIISPNTAFNLSGKQICILINKDNSFICDYISAIQYSGVAKVLAVGDLGLFENYKYYDQKLTDNIIVRIRLSENIYSDGSNKFIPDNTTFLTDEDIIYQEALRLITNKNDKTTSKIAIIQNYFVSNLEVPNSNFKCPPVSIRIFSLMKYWNIINYFNPNKQLFKKDWDKVLTEFIPKFINIENEEEYALTVANMVSQINDSHALLNSMILFEKINYMPGIKIYYVEDKTIIVGIKDENIIKEKRLFAGDIIARIDNYDVDSLRMKIANNISASNLSSLNREINYYLLGGKKESEIKLNVNHNGIEDTIYLKRNYELFEANRQEYNASYVWEKIDGEIGYVNLNLLSKESVDSMFNDLNNTKAIILDNRGYPLGTARDLANHLTNKAYIEAIISSLVVKSPDIDNIIYDNYYQRSVPENKLQYRGEIVILVNEFTQSQAEFLCMVLQGACNKVKIIGSQTAGADGIVSWIILPGGISTLFTAQKVCYPNGNNTQGKGIIPDVYVTPTIEGIRNGNDEIYQTAISYLKNNLK